MWVKRPTSDQQTNEAPEGGTLKPPPERPVQVAEENRQTRYYAAVGKLLAGMLIFCNAACRSLYGLASDLLSLFSCCICPTASCQPDLRL
ncbi:hypothetical protein KCP74_18365 [Salmonella enterica subsp. enterica]|nr:hypothetical protein KCP74_18365 [Salmonella enterica subsp. enterica]